jgi:hypothetical protein
VLFNHGRADSSRHFNFLPVIVEAVGDHRLRAILVG